MKQSLEKMQQGFNRAMELYEKKERYTLIGRFVSFINIGLQLYLLYRVFHFSIGIPLQIAAVLIAYIAADFINGWVHMFMDNNDKYNSMAGPLIASFHLHHRTPLYKRNNILKVYYHESGSKIWLVGYLLLTAIVTGKSYSNPFVSYTLVYIGILSSIAEVSHYLCHVSDYRFVKIFRYAGLLLSKKHHRRHHAEDNVSYAFLNGFTDPLLNSIARHLYAGYKNTTDLHYAQYTGKGTENR